ncbi:hypothetical protein HDV62DRAFT_370200 [Trichoderma sp. SZMC 28011]
MTQSRKIPEKCMPGLINMAMISKIDNDDIEDPSQLAIRQRPAYAPPAPQRYVQAPCSLRFLVLPQWRHQSNTVPKPAPVQSSPLASIFLYRCKGTK